MPRPRVRVVERWALRLGIAVLAYAFGTAAWAGIYQRHVSREFEQAVAAARDADAADAAVAPPSALRDGDVIGRLEIPGAGISVMVLQGVGRNVLAVGAGHVPGTPLPGLVGNVAIAAHRDTFFRRLEGIRAGDAIHLTTVGRAYEYVVDSTELVDPGDTRVIESRDRSELTLITCYPFQFVGAAPRRFVVHARPAFQERPMRQTSGAPPGSGAVASRTNRR